MPVDEVVYDKRLPTVQISQELLDELEAHKTKTGKSYGWIIRTAVREYLNPKKKKAARKGDQS